MRWRCNNPPLHLRLELDEATYARGVGRLTTLRRIFLPLIGPAIFYSGLMVGLVSASELPLPLMISPFLASSGE